MNSGLFALLRSRACKVVVIPISASLKLITLMEGILSLFSSLVRTLSWMLHASREVLGREGMDMVSDEEGKGLKAGVCY